MIYILGINNFIKNNEDDEDKSVSNKDQRNDDLKSNLKCSLVWEVI